MNQSGAALTPARRYLQDVWSYRPDQGWKHLADSPEPLVAAPSFVSGHSIFIMGGDNGTLASRINQLKDQHPGFSKLIRVFNTQTETWSTAGTLPLSLVTTNACVYGRTVYVPGGEDRPGHRSNRVFLWPLLP